MNAELIAVGTEILLGEIVNTDAQVISQGLSELGINVYYQTVVGDNPQRLERAIREAKDRADIIITTGGLGSTTSQKRRWQACSAKRWCCISRRLTASRISFRKSAVK